MSDTLKKWCGTVTAAGITAAVIVWWLIININSPHGNQFEASGAVQMLVYGRLAGLLAGLSFVFLLVTMGKGRLSEKLFPKSWLVKIHRRLGGTVLFFVLLHFVLVFAAKSDLYDDSFFNLVSDFAADGKWGTAAVCGAVLLIAVLIFCLLFVLKKMKFQQFKPTHYLVYAVVILLFFHQIFYGFDFVNHKAFRIFWTVLAALALLDAVVWKIRTGLAAVKNA